jgi:hypothetical protein
VKSLLPIFNRNGERQDMVISPLHHIIRGFTPVVIPCTFGIVQHQPEINTAACFFTHCCQPLTSHGFAMGTTLVQETLNCKPGFQVKFIFSTIKYTTMTTMYPLAKILIMKLAVLVGICALLLSVYLTFQFIMYLLAEINMLVSSVKAGNFR